MSTVKDTSGRPTAADEAAQLADVLRGWFASATPSPPAQTGGVPSPEPAVDEPHGGASCELCPVCRGIAAVRAVNPELVGHLAAAASSLSAALRELRTPRPGTESTDGDASWG